MKTQKRTWLGALLLAVAGLWASPARALTGTSSYLNIDVTITAALSVAVDNANSSTYSVTWSGTPNQQVFTPSSATVTNDSGILTERWKLFTNTNALDTTGGISVWALASSTMVVPADQYVVQAVFGSSNTTGTGCDAATSTGTYSNLTTAPILTTVIGSGLQYTTAGQLASAELNNDGTHLPDVSTNSGSMLGNKKRALCWRVIMPASTSTTNKQNIQVIVAAY